MTHAPMRSSEAQHKQKWQKLNMSNGQELEDSHHLPQKREKSENDAKCNRSRINIGEEFGRWTDLKTHFGLKTRAEVGQVGLITKSHI